MTRILESVTEVFTPEFLLKLGSATGLDVGLVSRGLAATAPVVTGAMAARAATPGGLDALMKLVPADGAGLGNLQALVSGREAGTLLSELFGPGLGAVGRALDQKLGFRASTLLPVIGPVIVALLGKARKEHSLDGGGIANLLAAEQQAFSASGGDAARMTGEVLASGAEAGRVRSAYRADDWRTIRVAPMAAAQVVMLSDPSGPIGTLKEASTVARAMSEGRPDSPAASLLAVAWDEPLALEELRALGGREATKDSLLGVVRSAVALVSANNPGEAQGYRRFLTLVATRVAEASKEGGFLGIGGVRVSAEEQAALEELNVAMA